MDNEAISVIVNSGRSRDTYLQQQLRELTWWLAKYQFRIKTVHLSGRLNRIPDLLSRWGEGPAIQKEFMDRVKNRNVAQKYIKQSWFNFSASW